jgi:uncharacterized cupredoxin-like copper-binding protein
MSRDNRRTMAAGAAALGAVALLTAACGGGSSPTANARSATSTTGSSAGTFSPGSTSTSSSSGSTSSIAGSYGTTGTSGRAGASTAPGGTTPTSRAATTTTARPGTTTTARPTTTTAAGTTNVTASETEYKITLSQGSFHPGSYAFKAVNNGTITHALTINGPGVSDKSTGDLSPGDSATLTVTLQAGTYELWCPIDSHKSLGMDIHITVS